MSYVLSKKTVSTAKGVGVSSEKYPKLHLVDVMSDTWYPIPTAPIIIFIAVTGPDLGNLGTNTAALGTAMRIAAGEEPYNDFPSTWLGELSIFRILIYLLLTIFWILKSIF